MKHSKVQAVIASEGEIAGVLKLNTDRRDRLHYLADMVRELQTMAEREGCTTLAGLLWLTQSEATLQAGKTF